MAVLEGQAVLELKFISRYPQWFREMVQTFHIMQTDAAKYTGGVQLHGEQHFNSAFAALSAYHEALMALEKAMGARIEQMLNRTVPSERTKPE